MLTVEGLGTVGNKDTWTVVWEGSNDVPVDPQEVESVAVTWTFRTRGNLTPMVVTQALSDKTATGTFEVDYTPTVPGAYLVKARCVIDGGAEAITESQRMVLP